MAGHSSQFRQLLELGQVGWGDNADLAPFFVRFDAAACYAVTLSEELKKQDTMLPFAQFLPALGMPACLCPDAEAMFVQSKADADESAFMLQPHEVVTCCLSETSVSSSEEKTSVALFRHGLVLPAVSRFALKTACVRDVLSLPVPPLADSKDLDVGLVPIVQEALAVPVHDPALLPKHLEGICPLARLFLWHPHWLDIGQAVCGALMGGGRENLPKSSAQFVRVPTPRTQHLFRFCAPYLVLLFGPNTHKCSTEARQAMQHFFLVQGIHVDVGGMASSIAHPAFGPCTALWP